MAKEHWYKRPFRKEQVHKMFIEIQKFCVDPCVQIIYEYIIELENEIERLNGGKIETGEKEKNDSV